MTFEYSMMSDIESPQPHPKGFLNVRNPLRRPYEFPARRPTWILDVLWVKCLEAGEDEVSVWVLRGVVKRFSKSFQRFGKKLAKDLEPGSIKLTNHDQTAI